MKLLVQFNLSLKTKQRYFGTMKRETAGCFFLDTNPTTSIFYL